MASCGKCLHKEVCVDYRYYKPIAEKCQHFKEFNVDKKLQTNADRIRSMSDEELAELFGSIADDGKSCSLICGDLDKCKRNNSIERICKNHYLKWLKQPAK